MSAALTQPEATALDECEATISAGMRTFVSVGKSLLRIRDDRLYRTTYGTFEDYCRERWGWSASRGRQLIDAAEAAESVTSVTPPANEAQARELVGLEPKQAQATWQRATDATDGKPTAAAVKEAREQVAPKPPTKVTHTETNYVDTDTGEIVDERTPKQPHVARPDSPAAVASKAMTEARNRPWSVFATKTHRDFKLWGEWLQRPDIGGPEGLLNDLFVGDWPDPVDSAQMAYEWLSLAEEWIGAVKAEIKPRLNQRMRAVK